MCEAIGGKTEKNLKNEIYETMLPINKFCHIQKQCSNSILDKRINVI